ncbi:MAG: NAD-dependent succinate-semialdehyde dehydrogenase [Acidimicrobiia bacterium]|nr:NAD-dependent succinate-semialdehyde dehydrogenase [Acidimicrobiia bacterium]
MLYIDGEWRGAASGSSFEVINPATGESIGDVADGTRQDAADAILAASGGFSGWSRFTAFERAEYLYRAYQLMMERKEALARLMTEEQGKPLKTARNEVQYAADFFLWYAEEAKRTYGDVLPAPRSDQRFLVIRQPVGVVAAITPWNYPVSMITRKVAPALAAGCSIVVKPAEQTPLCAMEVFNVIHDAGIPAGVANLIVTADPAPIGAEFVENPAVAKITFTGSTEVGTMLAGRAASQMKRLSLELGGHAPFIVFDDADPAYAAKGASLVKFLNTGQACISPNRIYVHKTIMEPFLAVLEERVSRLRAGNGLADDTSIGPLVDHAALEKVDHQVQDAVGHGARLHSGGHRLTDGGLDRGFFYAPTVLSGVTPEMEIYNNETFGPVAPVISFTDEVEVLALANRTTYGLAAYVYTQQLGRAMRMFEELNYGIIGVNDINPTAAAAPFGGMKHSGVGREGGREGIAEYLETKLGGFSV